jgi:outer membrane receptor protein involved in Fe transport
MTNTYGNTRHPSGRRTGHFATRNSFWPLAVAVHLALGIALSMPARAAAAGTPSDLSDLSLEDLLKIEFTSASKYSQSSREAPSAVQVFTSDEIRRYGWRTLAEALQSLPGVYASSDRAYIYAGARGFLVPGDYNTRFLLLLDGQRLNDNIYEQANFGNEFPLDLALVERIEYVPGPGSSIYGSNAMFGVINVITRRAKSSPALAISTSIGSFRDRSVGVTAQYRAPNEGPGVLFSASRALEGRRDTRYPEAIGLPTADGSPATDDVARGLDNQVVERAFLKFTNGNFSASVFEGSRRVQPSAALYGSNFNDNRLTVYDVTSGAMAEYTRALNTNLTLVARASYQHFEYRANYPYIDATIGPYVVDDVAIGDWINAEGRLLYTGFAGHKLMLGVDIQSDVRALQKTRDIDVILNPTFEVNQKSRRSSIFVQDEWSFAPGWLLNAGLRHDQYSGRSSTTSPRLALIWNASNQTTFKLLGGRAYRVANAYERLYESVGYLSNPALNPETVKTVEVVGEHRIGTNQQIAVSLFDYKLDNLISQVPVDNGAFQYRNQATTEVRGMEATYRLRAADGLNLSTSLALNSDGTAPQSAASRAPRWVAKVRASHTLFSPRVIGALEVNAISSRKFVANGRPLELGTESIANLIVTASDVLPGLDAQFKITNLFDRENFYAAPNEVSITRIPIYGRQWSLNLLYDF